MDKVDGVTISLKEIYEEVKKTTLELSGLCIRIDRLEGKMQKQEDGQQQFKQKLTLQLISSIAVPLLLAVLILLAREGLI